jgi:hypothetical protein
LTLDHRILGDFNMIYLDMDKSNDRLNRRMMNSFRRTLNHLEVRELQLVGRKFTWSNEHASPTMTRIDRVFCTIPWEDLHYGPVLHPLSTSVSDHSPLLLQSQHHTFGPPTFRFEAHWPLMLEFSGCVQHAWSQPTPVQHNAMLTLHIKLARTAKALSAWSKKLIPMGKLAGHICREVIAQLDIAQESRALSEDEIQLRKLLKHMLLGLAAIDRSRARQKSRLTWLKKGDTNTKYFHTMANIRKTRNYITVLKNDSSRY